MRIRVLRWLYFRALGRLERPIMRCRRCGGVSLWERADGKLRARGIITHSVYCVLCLDDETAEVGSPAYFGTGIRAWTYTAHPLRMLRGAVGA